MAAASTVLRSMDLCRVITEYQIGITQDSLVFRVFNEEACETLLSDAIPAILSLLEKSQIIFSSWYQAVALSRLDNVLELMPPIRYIALYDAAYYNRLDALKGIHRLYRMEYACDNLLNLTARNGSLDCLRFLIENGYEGLTSRAIDGAAEQGHLDVVKYLHEVCELEETTAAMDLAATNGHFSVVQYLQTHCEEGSTMAAINNSAANGHLAIVQYLHKHRHRASHQAMDRAAANGHLDVVQFLHRHRNEGFPQRALEEANAHGHQHIVAYLTRGQPSDGRCILKQSKCHFVMFARTHSTLSADVLRVIESILMEAPEDHAVHYMRGLQQIREYMTKFHAGADGSSLSFEDMALKWNGEWQEHVDKAKSSPIATATERAMLPFMEGLSGIDIRVAARGRPDDAIYNGDEYARRYYPRGNYVAKWNVGNKIVYFPLVRAYPKFTGHEDDGELLNQDNDTSSIASEALSKYFTKPATETKTVISTTKENGEAAHLAVLKKADGSFVYLVGSKNVHMAIQTKDDIEKAIAIGSLPGQNPFAGARPVAFGILRMLDKLAPAKRSLFCEFLWQTRLTASFELLCPNHQHVELLDVPEDTPVLFGFSFPTLNSMPGIEICMNPLLGYALAHFCGVRTVAFDVVAYTGNEFKNVLSAIKSGYQTEGKVNLYIDEEGCVIGLQKYKTAWYVSLRAIREKSKSFLSNVLSKKKKLQVPDALALSEKQLTKRFGAIATWLQLPHDKAQEYCNLGIAFISYIANVRLAACNNNSTTQKSVQHEVTDLFPIVWRDFLATSGVSDRIDCK